MRQRPSSPPRWNCRHQQSATDARTARWNIKTPTVSTAALVSCSSRPFIVSVPMACMDTSARRSRWTANITVIKLNIMRSAAAMRAQSFSRRIAMRIMRKTIAFMVGVCSSSSSGRARRVIKDIIAPATTDIWANAANIQLDSSQNRDVVEICSRQVVIFHVS